MKTVEIINGRFSCIVVFVAVLSGCSGSSSSNSNASGTGILPLVTPIVKTAIPTGLGGSGGAVGHFAGHSGVQALDMNVNGTSQMATDVSALQSRFFGSAGPTEIVGQLLPQLDSLIKNVNAQAASSTSSCLTQTPVSFTISPAGQSVTMYAQCYSKSTPQFTGDPGFFQFGIKSGVTYIYSASGVEWVAAIVTPIANTTSQYTLQAYIGLGYANTPWDSGSYGLMELTANSNTGTFELAIAGSGYGYCGAQLVSDGTNVFASISTDMGQACGTGASGTTSGVTDDLCVMANSVTTAATCTTAQKTFSQYSIGRQGGVAQNPSAANNNNSSYTYGATTYPTGAGNVLFNGTSTDAIHFGPTTPTTGTSSL